MSTIRIALRLEQNTVCPFTEGLPCGINTLYYKRMKKHMGFLFLLILLFVFGCSKSAEIGAVSNYSTPQEMRARAPDLAYDDADFLYRGSGGATEEYVVEGTSVKMTAAAPQTAFDGDGETPLVDLSQRKLVKKANLRIRVENLETADSSISALMAQYGAYSSSTVTNENNRNYVIRVPSSVYDPFLAAVNDMGRILHRSESAEDVSLRYFDLENRLETRRELLKTFREYLGKARNIEEILSVEARIAELQNEIDRTGKDLRNLAGLVDYSTVSLDILGPVASESYGRPTLAERMKELFGGFGTFLLTATVIITGLLIYGVPVLLMLVLLFWLFFGRVGLLKRLYRIAAGKKPVDGA